MSERRAAGERTLTLDFSILGRDYRIACQESERAELVEAVALLDGRMREIRDTGKVAGVDRIAVMAALNLAHDLLRERKEAGAPRTASVDDAAATRRIQDMAAAIEDTLGRSEKLF